MFKILWNLLALLGLALVALLIFAIVRTGPAITNLAEFDPGALRTYGEIAQKLVITGSGPEATVWKVPVQEGLTPEEVEDTMRFVANENNIKNVGELPLYKEVEAMTGKPFRFLKIYMFCNAMTAARMLEVNDAFSAYLPCRITMVEDKEGKLWLYTLNMDLMIYGGKVLPDELRAEAIKVKEIILDIMNRGATGEF